MLTKLTIAKTHTAAGTTNPLSVLNTEIANCDKCPGMNIPGETQSAPGYGSPTSPIMLVGQSLCGPCMETGIPFTGGSGRLIDAALTVAGRRKDEIFTTNVVHCHPPDNQPSEPAWIANCADYLRREFAVVRPWLIVGLGEDARTAIRAEYPNSPALEWWPFIAPAHPTTDGPALLFLPHPRWVMTRPAHLREAWVVGLASAINWAFRGPTVETA
ncbi:uracil-DNA glycosylase family protein [Mycobacterium sp. E3298]|uniref:uracil-DNA glycosylase n=1 Tax=Mycobacterium sp. E3298 TaxID=1856865 RepID=UPI001E34D937|nr:uracil-DNA glycosylase family protein [Mycobacterium sp. E3298]